MFNYEKLLKITVEAHQFEFDETDPQIRISELLDFVEVKTLKKLLKISGRGLKFTKKVEKFDKNH